ETLNIEKSETQLFLSYGRSTASVTYEKLAQSDVGANSTTREAVALGYYLKISKYWNLSALTQHDLTNSRPIYRQVGIVYTDECVQIGLDWRRDYTSDRDIRPSNSILLVFQLANMG